jgi:hypothetical protein
MSKISLEGNVSGSGTLTIAAPNTNSNFTLSLPTNTGTIITQNSTPAFASTIGVGGATAAASGAGITFPATMSASSDANTLDDYEEGTWTPAFGSSDGPSTGGSTTVNAAIYKKIGKMVVASCDIEIATKGSQNGGDTARIWGMPFTCSNSETGGASIGLFLTLGQNVNWIGATNQGGLTCMLIRLTTVANANITNGTWTSLYTTGTRFMITTVYQVD